MIFKTIDDNDSLSGQRIVSKFTARKIAQEEATKQLEIDIQCLRNYEAECQKGSVSTETFSNTMKGASIEAQKYATNIKEGTGSAQTFAANQRTIQSSMSETSIVSKIAATGLSIFKAALNSLIFFAVIDNLILTADEAEEKAEALRGNMQSFFDEVQSGQQTISSVSDRFAELSEHVTKTGENIDLTKDEYSEYLDICNQVKTIMPELVTGYTNEGNAIITLKDNVNSLTESYKENIRAKAAAFITNGDDDGNTIQSFFDDYKNFTEGENGLFAPSAGGLWNNKSTDYEDYYGYDKVHEWLEDVADLSLKDLQNLQKGTTQATYLYALLKENGYELSNITEDNYEAVHDVLDIRLTSLEGEMATRVSNVKMSLQQMLYADRDYWDIDDKEALSAIDSMFSSIDSEFIKQNNLLGQDALQSFESNVIKLFENKDTQKAMIDIYTPQGDDESIEDYSRRVNDAIEKVQNYAKDKKIDVSLDFTDATGSVEDLQKSYDDTINRFKDSNKIKDFFTTEGINIQDEIDAFNDVTKGINDADKAIQIWNEHKKESNETPISFDDPSSLFNLNLSKKEKEKKDNNSTANLSDLQDEADLLRTIQDGLKENNKISTSSLEKIISLYPEAKSALADYMSGLISEKELFAELERIYESDTRQYINSLVEKNAKDAQFFDAVKANNESLFNTLSTIYGYDVTNWKNLEQAKVDITAQAVKKIALLYQSIANVNNGLEYVSKVNSNTAAGTGEHLATNPFSKAYSPGKVEQVANSQNNDEYTKLQNGIKKILSDAENAKKSLTDAAYNTISSKIDTSWQGLSPEKSSSKNSNKNKSNKNKSNQDIDWIETLISRIERRITNLGKTVSTTYKSWSERNGALGQELSAVNDQISAEQQAYNRYMMAANSVGLDEHYASLVRNGAMDITTITDDDLKTKIESYKKFYEAALSASDKIQDLQDNLIELNKTKFDNISKQFDGVLKKIEAINTQLKNESDIIESKGYMASTYLYSAMIEEEQANLNNLNAERNALVNAFRELENSGVTKESEQWWELQSSIDEVTSSIQEATKSLVEYNNEMRQIKWDAFDFTRDNISSLIDETDFLVNVFESLGNTDKKTGDMNENGKASQALLAQKYQLYLSQAKEYGEEIDKINADLANNPYDKNLIERKRELIKSQQEAIKSALDEKDAIKDLINNAYTEYKNKLDEIISKYKDMISTAKDAYDYEKNIAEKTKNITTLEKQYNSYKNDDSEEGKKNRQTIKAQLDDAKKDLEQTQYEQLISDTEKLLDDLSSDTEELFNERMDNIDGLINDVINESNQNASQISETITSTSDSLGYKLSDDMTNIWKTNTDNINGVLTNYGNKFIEGQTNLNNVVNQIKSFTERMLANSDAEAARKAAEIAAQQAAQDAHVDYSTNGNNSSTPNSNSNNGNSGGGSSSDGQVHWIHSVDRYPKSKLKVNVSLVDRLKSHDYLSSWDARAQYYKEMGIRA